MSVRGGPAKEPQITGLATIGAHTDQGENHGFKQTSASRLTDVLRFGRAGNGPAFADSLIRLQRPSVILVRGPGGVCSILYIHSCGVGRTLRNNQTKTLTPLASGPAFPKSLDLDLATGFEKTATLVADRALRCEGPYPFFGFQKKRGPFFSSVFYFPLSVLTIPFSAGGRGGLASVAARDRRSGQDRSTEHGQGG